MNPYIAGRLHSDCKASHSESKGKESDDDYIVTTKAVITWNIEKRGMFLVHIQNLADTIMERFEDFPRWKNYPNEHLVKSIDNVYETAKYLKSYAKGLDEEWKKEWEQALKE